MLVCNTKSASFTHKQKSIYFLHHNKEISIEKTSHEILLRLIYCEKKITKLDLPNKIPFFLLQIKEKSD